MSSYKIKNVNVAFDMLLEAAEAYEGYLLGIPETDIITAVLSKTPKEKNKKAIHRARKKFIAKLLDRTNAGMKIVEMNRMGQAGKLFKDGSQVISVFHVQDRLGVPPLEERCGPDAGTDEVFEDYKRNRMQQIVKHMSPTKIKRSVTNSEDAPPKSDPNAGSEGVKKTASTGESVRTVSLEETNLSVGDLYMLNNSLNTSITNPNRLKNPSLGAIVIKDPAMGFNARGAAFAPLFFSAITPLEMSRCTPFIDIKVITNQPKDRNNLGIYQFLRVTNPSGDSRGMFSGPNGPFPVSDAETIQGIKDGGSRFNFMDLFTSPQTMVNPSINKEHFGEQIADIFDFKGGGSREKDATQFSTVRDPMQPFMSLLSFNVQVAGSGHGLMSTKRAYMKLKLHDKSRLADVSTFLSPNDFGSTKFIVNFGWSHPDGDIRSSNEIGKFLDALRDGGVYQLISADYTFGNDNSVDITLQLTCSGFQQMSSISCAAGQKSNINVIKPAIESYLNNLIDSEKVAGKKNKGKARHKSDIRGELKVAKSDLSKNSILIDFEKLSELNTGFLSSAGDESTTVSKVDVLKKIYTTLYSIPGDDFIDNLVSETDPEKLDSLISDLVASAINAKNESTGDIIYAKFLSLFSGIDPFRGQVCNNYINKLRSMLGLGVSVDDQHLIGTQGSYKKSGDHVSLGKIISCFVGYPMSSAGIYDEVQMYFYPVNAQSAAARKHTTASLPIKRSDLRKGIDSRLLSGESTLGNLSVKGFFAILDRILSSEKISAYGIYDEKNPSATGVASLQNKLDEYNKKSLEAKVTEARDPESKFRTLNQAEIAAEEGAGSATGADRTNKINRAIARAYFSFLAQKVMKQKGIKLREVFNAEADMIEGTYNPDNFQPVELAMHFEVVPMSAESASSDDILENLAKNAFKFVGGDRRSIDSDGTEQGKSILRIHVYDANSNMVPDLSIYGTTFEPKGNTKNTDDPESDSTKNQDITKSIKQLKSKGYNYFKSLLMQNHTSIIHGTSTGVVKSIDVSANTTGQLSNVLITESYGASRHGGDNYLDEETDFDETVMLPATVDLTIQGFPTLARGQQFFIDFDTQTSLDNIYTVMTVNHTIASGEFTTRAVLKPANNMIVTSHRNKLLRMLSDIQTSS